MNKKFWQTLDWYHCTREDLEKDTGHSLVQVLRRSGLLWKMTVLKEFGIISRKRCCWNSQKADVRFSVLRLYCPEVSSKAKDMENCRFTLLPLWKQLRLFRIFVSANQLNLYGAVAEMCEEYESFHDRSRWPITVMGQSVLLSENKREVHLENDDPAYQNFVLQWYEERIERLSQQDRLSKFCMDAGFQSVVEIGQYFTTKNNGEQILCNGLSWIHSSKKRWIITTKRVDLGKHKKIGPVLKVTSSSLHGQHGVVIRILSLSENNTHSWVRISHGSNNFVMDPKRNDTEVPEDQPEEQAIQLNGKNGACRSKEKAKPQRSELVDKSPSIIPMNARNWIDIEPESHSLSAYEVSKKIIHLLRQQEQWEENGAVPFLENKTTYSESICTNSLLVRQSMGSMLGSRRRSKMEISVLHWCFRNNSFFPSSSRTYRTKSYWSFIAGQCNSAWNIPSHRR